MGRPIRLRVRALRLRARTRLRSVVEGAYGKACIAELVGFVVVATDKDMAVVGVRDLTRSLGVAIVVMVLLATTCSCCFRHSLIS